MMSMSFVLIIILFCVTSIKSINIVRIDGEQEFVVYINGLPLMAGGAYNMPAYQQLYNVMTLQGEIIPASVRYEKVGYNGRLRVLTQPRVFHMRIAIVRTGGQRSGTNVSTQGTAASPPPVPQQTVSTTVSPASLTTTEAVTQAPQTTTTEATSSAPTSSIPDTSSAPPTEAATEAANTSPSSPENTSETSAEESTTAETTLSELPSSSSELS